MKVSPAKAKKLARTLRRENLKNGRSWRTIAREDYQDQIDQSTLSRIARNKGKWIPKGEHFLILLGLITPRRPHPKPISEMSIPDLLHALRDREAMPSISSHQRKWLKGFVHQCRQAAQQRASAS